MTHSGKAWNPSEFEALKTALLISKGATWGAIIALALTVSAGMTSANKAHKALWGITSLTLLTGAWVSRASAVNLGKRVSLTNEALMLGFGEWLIDRLAPATSSVAVESEQPATNTPFDWSQLLTCPDDYPHLLLLGKTGSGKTWLAERLLSYLGCSSQVVTPHRKPGDFQGFEVIGGGRDYPAIAGALEGLLDEMQSRYQRFDKGDFSYPFLNIVVDEFPAIAANTKGATDAIKVLAREARKVKMRLILLSQGDEVKTLGIEGEGSLRECFTFVRLKGFCEKYAKQLKSPELQAWLKGFKHPCLVEDQPAVTADLLRLGVSVPAGNVPNDGTQAVTDTAQKLNQLMTAEPSPQDSITLSEPLTKLMELSDQYGWMDASFVKQRSRYFQQFSPDQIRAFFNELIGAGIGATRQDGANLQWCKMPSS